MTKTTETTIRSLIRAYEHASNLDKATAKHQLLLHYHSLSAADRSSARAEMEPFLVAIEQEMIAMDPFAREVNQLLNRVSKR